MDPHLTEIERRPDRGVLLTAYGESVHLQLPINHHAFFGSVILYSSEEYRAVVVEIVEPQFVGIFQIKLDDRETGYGTGFPVDHAVIAIRVESVVRVVSIEVGERGVRMSLNASLERLHVGQAALAELKAADGGIIRVETVGYRPPVWNPCVGCGKLERMGLRRSFHFLQVRAPVGVGVPILQRDAGGGKLRPCNEAGRSRATPFRPLRG
jgi:hypothetical protein